MVDIMTRFMAKTKNAENGCLEWTAARNGQGYGFFKFRGKNSKAHRVAWEIVNGPIPEGRMVLHSCDNPPCVFIGHLRIGTASENTLESVSKGRWPNRKGSASGRSCLSDSTVAEIRTSYISSGLSQLHLAEKYGISQAQVSNIVTRKHWSHI